MFDLVSNIDIVVLLKESGSFRNNNVLYSAIKSRLVPNVLSDENDKALKAFCAKYCYNLQRRWQNAHSKEVLFSKNNNEWLSSEIIWPDFIASDEVNLNQNLLKSRK